MSEFTINQNEEKIGAEPINFDCISIASKENHVYI